MLFLPLFVPALLERGCLNNPCKFLASSSLKGRTRWFGPLVGIRKGPGNTWEYMSVWCVQRVCADTIVLKYNESIGQFKGHRIFAT